MILNPNTARDHLLFRGAAVTPPGYSERVRVLQHVLEMRFEDGLLGPATAKRLRSCLTLVRGRWARPYRQFRRWYLGWHERWWIEAELNRLAHERWWIEAALKRHEQLRKFS